MYETMDPNICVDRGLGKLASADIVISGNGFEYDDF